MLKRLMLACALLLFLVLGLYVAWVTGPPDRNQQLMADAARRGRAHYDEVQRLAASPASNGLLQPTLHAYYTKAPLSPPGRAIDTWTQKYCQRGDQHADFLARRDPGYLKAREDVSRFVPSIHDACRRQVFAQPSQPRTSTVVSTSFVRTSRTADALAGYGRSLAAEGRRTEAVRVLLPGLNLAAALLDHTTCMADMIGLAIGYKALEPLFDTVAGEPLPIEVWREIAQTSYQCFPTSDQGATCLEGEIDWAREYRANPTPSVRTGLERFLFQLPGLNQRESRIVDNRHGDFLKQARAMEVPPTPPPASGRVTDWLAGREAFPSESLLGGDSLAVLAATVHQLALYRRKLAALYALALLELHHYPARLDILKPLPDFAWDHFDYQPKPNGCRLLLKLEPELLALPPRSENPKGYRVESNGLLFER